MIYALTGEAMIRVLDRLVSNELDRLKRIGQNLDDSRHD
jgi:hypothetical protein